MVMEPVHGGLLADLTEEAGRALQQGDLKYSQASWAMRWVMGLDNVQVVLSGMANKEQLEDNINTFEEALALTEEDHERIKKAAQIQRSAVAVACTACRYCSPNCPKGLDIPFLLKAYNEAKLSGAWRLAGLNSLPEDKKPSACVNCGSCRKHCPQGFDIPKYMEEMKVMMEKG